MRSRRIFLALALALVQAGAWSQEPAPPAAPQAHSARLDRTAVDALLATPDKVLFLDVRRPDELVAKGGFPVYLSIQISDLERQIAFIPRDRTIVTVSNHAARALKAADLLATHGFTVAGAIGVDNYAEQGGNIVKIAPPSPANPASGTGAR